MKMYHGKSENYSDYWYLAKFTAKSLAIAGSAYLLAEVIVAALTM